MFRIENLNIRKICSEFGISELRENFLKRGGGGREMAGNIGSPGGSLVVCNKKSEPDLE
jgi:hypothetical protein